MSEIVYEGLHEVAQALREVEAGVYTELVADLKEVGDVVRDDARQRFAAISTKTADGFETRVRTGSSAVVVVAQRLRKTTGRRPDYGALQMRHALLPARTAKHAEAVEILERGAGKLLAAHGF
jgi:hypothetical protein